MFSIHVINIVKFIILFVSSILIAFIFEPLLVHYLYKYKAWKKRSKKNAIDGADIPIFQKFHSQTETSTPRMGGILIWGTVLIVSTLILVVSIFFPQVNFLSRSETWLPLFTLISASVLGLVDDVMTIRNSETYIEGGLRLKVRLILISVIAIVGA